MTVLGAPLKNWGIKMKILIISFPRSGTTLTQRIIKSHPDVQNMFFETNHLKKIGVKK